MTPTSRGLAKRKGGRGSRFQVRATEEAATAHLVGVRLGVEG